MVNEKKIVVFKTARRAHNQKNQSLKITILLAYSLFIFKMEKEIILL